MSVYCVWCYTKIIPEVEWQTFFFPEKPRTLCQKCEASLEKIDLIACEMCGRPSTKDKQQENPTICPDCAKWQQDPRWKSILTFNRSVYQYNPLLQDMITKWKYRGDYHVFHAFEEAVVETFKHYFVKTVPDAILVPIPLSAERLEERAFNQAKVLADLLPYQSENVLQRIHGEKQAKKTRQERLDSTNPFVLKSPITKTVILIDDIYTTGTTLRHAAKILKQQGCPKVYAFTLAR